MKDAEQALQNAEPYLTEWNETTIRQLVECVTVLSKDEILVRFKGGREIRHGLHLQKIDYSCRIGYNNHGVIDVEKRVGKIMIQTPGGTAAKGSYTYKLSIPSLWIKQMGISEDDRQIELCFDGTTIHVSKRLSVEAYIAANRKKEHALYEMLFYDEKLLCTKIIADYTTKTVCIENYVDDFLQTAFGNNAIPTWEDYEAFLESRCIAKSRSGLREYLETIGVDQYDPLKIVQKTNGRMAEDHQWLRVVKLS